MNSKQKIPTRCSILLHYDIKFQSAQVQKHLLVNRCEQILAKNNNEQETNPQHEPMLMEPLIIKTFDNVDIKNDLSKNFISIGQLYQHNNDDIGKYLLCRVITPLIPNKSFSSQDLGSDESFFTVVDDPEGFNLVHVLFSKELIHRKLNDGNLRRSSVRLNALNGLLPLGSVLIIENPTTYFNNVGQFHYISIDDNNLSDVYLGDINNNNNGILKDIQWKGNIPSKYSKLYTISSKDNLETQDSNQLHSATEQKYPIHEWLLSPNILNKALDCAEYEGPCYIQNIEGKGRGLIATSFIPKGSLILAKKPFALSFIETELSELTNTKELNEVDKEAFNKWTDVLNSNKIALRLVMEPNWAEKFYNLYAGPTLGVLNPQQGNDASSSLVDMERITQIVKYNGIANRPYLSTKNTKTADQSQLFSAQQMTTGLWITPAFINHSCSQANSFWKIWGDMLLIRSFKDISPGTEILMSYRGGLSQCSFNQRQKLIFKGMNFSCDCRLCKIESQLSFSTHKEIEELLKEFVDVNVHELLGTEFYRVELLFIIDELKNYFKSIMNDLENIQDEKNEILNLLEVYLYQPYKILAMSLLVEVANDEGMMSDEDANNEKLRQVGNLLEKAYQLIQGTSDCGKGIGCCLDLICIWLKLHNVDKVRQWFEALKTNVIMIYGICEEHLDEVLELILKRYKLTMNDLMEICK